MLEKVSAKKLVTMSPDEMVVSFSNISSKIVLKKENINNDVTTNVNFNKNAEKALEKEIGNSSINIENEAFLVADSTTIGDICADVQNGNNVEVTSTNNDVAGLFKKKILFTYE